MSKSKKVTYKELKDRLDFCFYKSAEIEQAINYTHSLLLEYISFEGTKNDFLKYLKEKKKDDQKRGSTTGRSGENTSGDTIINTKSGKTREEASS